MSIHRELMDDALKAQLVPALLQRGFTGSLPHFRRRLADRIDFAMVQFSRSGGRFTLEVGQTGPEGLKDPSWPDLDVSKTTVAHLRHRARVARGFWRKQWFKFGPRVYDRPKPAKPAAFYEAIARDALKAFQSDGEAWLARRPALAEPGP